MRDHEARAAFETGPMQGRGAAYPYHLLRAALAAGKPGLTGLDEGQLEEISRQADKTFELESLVLGSAQAVDTIVPCGRVEQAVAEVRGRYPDRDSFLADLCANGLDEEMLRRALQRELIFDAVMQRVAARAPAVGELDERLFFELHKDQFSPPERRTVRHILITVNEALPENRRDAARARIEHLADKLGGRANRFPSLARRHSECPTAMQDGRLGTVPRGQLYATLDAVLFTLPEGAVSVPVESEMGFHLLWCEKVHHGSALPFSKVQPRIRQALQERAARNCQRAWIARLRQARSDRAPRIKV